MLRGATVRYAWGGNAVAWQRVRCPGGPPGTKGGRGPHRLPRIYYLPPQLFFNQILRPPRMGEQKGNLPISPSELAILPTDMAATPMTRTLGLPTDLPTRRLRPPLRRRPTKRRLDP